MAKITKIAYDLPEYLKRGSGLILSCGPDAKRLHDAMRKAGKVAVPQKVTEDKQSLTTSKEELER